LQQGSCWEVPGAERELSQKARHVAEQASSGHIGSKIVNSSLNQTFTSHCALRTSRFLFPGRNPPSSTQRGGHRTPHGPIPRRRSPRKIPTPRTCHSDRPVIGRGKGRIARRVERHGLTGGIGGGTRSEKKDVNRSQPENSEPAVLRSQGVSVWEIQSSRFSTELRFGLGEPKKGTLTSTASTLSVSWVAFYHTSWRLIIWPTLLNIRVGLSPRGGRHATPAVKFESSQASALSQKRKKESERPGTGGWKATQRSRVPRVAPMSKKACSSPQMPKCPHQPCYGRLLRSRVEAPEGLSVGLLASRGRLKFCACLQSAWPPGHRGRSTVNQAHGTQVVSCACLGCPPRASEAPGSPSQWLQRLHWLLRTCASPHVCAWDFCA
jgi:hypothetical protein